MKDPDCTEKINIAHAIRQHFRYQYKEQWVSEQYLKGRSRLWTQVFNDFLKQGLIEKKKSKDGNKYRWVAHHPF